MYNPDKQARGAGGRFGGKKVEAPAAEPVMTVADIKGFMGEASAPSPDAPRAGQFVRVNRLFDDGTVSDGLDFDNDGDLGVAVGVKHALVLIFFAIAVLAIIYGAVQGIERLF
jgi:hypothetical protein